MKATFLFFCCLVILIIGLLFPAFYTKTVHDHVYMANAQAKACDRFLQKAAAEDLLSDCLYDGAEDRVIFGELKNGDLTVFQDASDDITYMTNELTPSVYWGAFIHNGQIDYICSSEKNLTEKDIKYYQFEEQVSLSSFWNACSVGFYSISENQPHDII